MSWLLCIVGAYLLGSVPFGLLIGLSRGIDIRRAGSGNIGATNVTRLLGRRVGIACFGLDAGKGAVPVVIAGLVHGLWGRSPAGPAGPAALEIWLWLAVLVAALLGHMCSPWLGFRGGKGVATGFGGMLAMWPLLTVAAIAALLVWLLVLRLSRLVSLASISAVTSLPLAAALDALRRHQGPAAEALADHLPVLVTTGALAVLVIWKHRANIARLRAGTESKVGKKTES